MITPTVFDTTGDWEARAGWALLHRLERKWAIEGMDAFDRGEPIDSPAVWSPEHRQGWLAAEALSLAFAESIFEEQDAKPGLGNGDDPRTLEEELDRQIERNEEAIRRNEEQASNNEGLFDDAECAYLAAYYAELDVAQGNMAGDWWR